MPQTDLPLDQLRTYDPPLPVPDDLDEFWARTLAEAATIPLDARFTRVASGLVAVETWDVSFTGYGGQRIRAWLHLPAAALRGAAPLPGIAQFQGYNGGRGLPHEHVFWATAGYAQLVMDTRGQGSGWTVGDTPDAYGCGVSQPGYLTRGIERPDDYYYRRVFVDAVRAIEVLGQHPLVDADRVVAAGISQGGGIALAASILASSTPASSARSAGVRAVLPDVPLLCDFRRAARITSTEPYQEITRYLKAHRERAADVFSTLAYFDCAVLARRATVPALFSVALMDQTCPPSTVFAAYHAYAGRKEIAVYEYNDHEGGEAFQQARQMEWLSSW